MRSRKLVGPIRRQPVIVAPRHGRTNSPRATRDATIAAPVGLVECEVAGALVLPPWVSWSVSPRVLTAFRARRTPKHVLATPCGLRCAHAGIPPPCCNVVRDSRYGLRCALRDWRLEACSRVSNVELCLLSAAAPQRPHGRTDIRFNSLHSPSPHADGECHKPIAAQRSSTGGSPIYWRCTPGPLFGTGAAAGCDGCRRWLFPVHHY